MGWSQSVVGTYRFGVVASERSIYIAMPNASSLRRGDWKLISRGNGRKELYCIATDPYEKVDLASKESGKVEELSKLLAIEQSKDITRCLAISKASRIKVVHKNYFRGASSRAWRLAWRDSLRQRSLQYLTCSHTLAHFFLH